MATRLALHDLLKTIIGSNNVYYQKPDNTKMVYPCIVYELNKVNTRHADNVPYRLQKQYKITVIDRDPDSLIPDKISMLPSSAWATKYVTENLHHTVYTIYF